MKNRASGHPHGRNDVPRPAPRPDDGNAFLPDTIGQGKPLGAADAESFAEEFIGSATQGEPVYESAHEEVADDEEGGPFIVLDDEGRLPPEPDERDAEREGHEPVEHEHAIRGANWAAKGV